jgi:predicted permease
VEKLKKFLIITLVSIFVSIATISVVSAQDFDYTYTDPSVFMGLGFAACLAFGIIWFIVFILIAIWVYKDAEKRGSSGILWLLIVLILGIIGIIIWLVVRPPIGGKSSDWRPSTTAICDNNKVEYVQIAVDQSQWMHKSVHIAEKITE